MNCIITDDDWRIFLEKYGNLMYYISKKITGDVAICSVDDNMADLSIAAMNCIKSLEKKTGKSPNEIITSGEFSSYIKTCLWNCKSKKGNVIKSKYHIRRSCPVVIGESGDTISVDSLIEDPKDHYKRIKDISPKISTDAKKLLKAAKKNIYHKNSNGNEDLDISKVSRAINLSVASTKEAINNLKKNYKNEYEQNS